MTATRLVVAPALCVLGCAVIVAADRRATARELARLHRRHDELATEVRAAFAIWAALLQPGGDR